MKFSRRAEGIKESRAVFKRAREDTRSSHHVSNVKNLQRVDSRTSNREHENITTSMIIVY